MTRYSKESSAPTRPVDKQTRMAMQRVAIKAIREGQSYDYVAEFMGVTKRTIFRWMVESKQAHYQETHHTAGTCAGAPNKLDQAELQWIAQNIRDKTPEHFGYDSGLWTPTILIQVISSWLDITISLSTVLRYLEKMGIVRATPLRLLRQEHGSYYKRWISVEYPKLTHEARRTNARLSFLNIEMISSSDFYYNPTWPSHYEGKPIEPYGSNFRMYIMSENPIRGEYRFRLHGGQATPESIVLFLDCLLVGLSKKTYLISNLEGFAYSTELQTFVQTHSDRLRLIDLP